MNATQQKEVVALVTWLQTFPEFVFSDDPIAAPAHRHRRPQANKLIADDQTHVAVETLVTELDTWTVVRAIETVATLVINGPDAVPPSRENFNAFVPDEFSNDDDNDDNNNAAASAAAAEQIWASLFDLTSTRARPLVHQEDDELDSNGRLSAFRLKSYVLANLLDCAVQNPDLRQRRAFIERIMKLPKPTQKALMSLIERRSGGKNGSASSSKKKQQQQQQHQQQNGTPTKSPTPSKSPKPLKSALKKTPPRQGGVAHNSGGSGNANYSSQSQGRHSQGQGHSPVPAAPPFGYSPQRSDHSPQRPDHSHPSNNNNNNRSSSSGGGRSRSHSVPPSDMSPQRSGLQSEQSLGAQTYPSSSGSKSQQQQYQHQQHYQTPMSPASSHMTEATEVRDNTSATRNYLNTYQPSPPAPPKTTTNKSGGSRSHSNAFASPSGHTPEPKRKSSSSSSSYRHTASIRAGGTGERELLSPGTLESPGQVQSVVADLQHRNDKYQHQLQAYQAQEEIQRQRVEQTEAAHRKQMIKLESTAMDREQDMQRQYEERVASLEAHLKQAEADRDKGQAAMEELDQARDEMDLMNHSRGVLHETTEKLRKYKDKVAELQDVKEAFQREQEAHGQSIDEVVRLENELETLKPLKRQLDDYRIRAIEAEVKLVETQDYLRRLEQQANDESARNDHLWKGAAMQQEQVEELQQRIQQDTQAAMDSGSGVGDGVSELNPEIQRELFRLRNENLQLRAFAAKRESDGVQKLEETLDDTKRLADRYKENFLSSKSALAEIQVVLTETQQRESQLIVDVEEWRERSDLAETRTRVLEEKLEHEREHLENVRGTLSETEDQNSAMRSELVEWKEELEVAEATSTERFEQLQSVLNELKETQDLRAAAEEMVQELRCSVSALEVQAKEMQEAQELASHDLQCTQELLTETRVSLAETQTRETNLEGQVEKTKQESARLQETLEEERQSNHDAIEESQNSLEATRQVLNAKWEKELEQLRGNMNQLLEEERRAYRNQVKDAEHKHRELETEFKKEYAALSERSTSSDQQARQEAQERLEFVQNEHKAEIENIKKEAEDSKDTLIRKGRTMINEAKAKAKKELQTLDDECMAMEAKLAKITKEKLDTEHQLRTKVASLKQKIDFSNNQINDLTRDGDEFQEKVKTMEREKFKLQEDNDRYRRQLGGRYGADGKEKAQLEKLQREYNAMLEENRNIKKQARDGGGSGLASIGESDPSEEGSHGYSRGGVNRTTLSQMRQEYEEQLEGLNDEKRELIMKNSAASTDVQKAEQRAWEREQEVAKLKSEITSLQLAHQRSEFSVDHSMDVGREKELSFFSAHDEERSPAYNPGDDARTPDRGPAVERLRSAGKHTSPGISRALQQKRERETALLGKLSSLTGSPSRPFRSPDLLTLNTSAASSESSSHQVLTPTGKYHNEANKLQQSPRAKLAADVYGLQTGDKVKPFAFPSSGTGTGTSTSTSASQPKTLMDYTQVDESRVESDERPECNQS